MSSQAKTVKEYLSELPAERRASLAAVCEAIRKNLDQEYEEGMQWGMIWYYVPHSVYPKGYHCDPTKPLGYIGVGAFKNYFSLMMMPVYGDPQAEAEFRAAWAKTGKKLDMGKACIRFKSADDLPLDLIGQMTRKFTARAWAAHCEALVNSRQASKKTPAKKVARKKAAAKKKAARR